MSWLDNFSWFILIVACLTVGLAPFAPPHIWEKLQMLSQGRLVRPIDWVDLVFHAIPWILLLAKGARTVMR